MHYALIADLENSRLVKDRRALSARLSAAIEQVSSGFADEWVAPMTSAKGIDELSSALVRPNRAFDIAVAMNEAVWPERFRWALASGTIDIGLESGDASALDGTAFHAAADGLERARRHHLLLTVSLDALSVPTRDLIEAAALAHADRMQDWSPRQHDIVKAARAQPVQLEVARELGVTPQTVSQGLRRAGFETMTRIEQAIAAVLAQAEIKSGATA